MSVTRLALRTDWTWHSVKELQDEGVLLVEDGNHGEYRPRPNEFTDDGTAFLRAADLSDGEVLFSAAGQINDVALRRIRKGIGKPGDLLFSHKGTVGKLAVAHQDAPSFVCSPQTTFWRVTDPKRLDRQFLFAYMRAPEFQRQWTVRKGDTDMADYVSLTAQRTLLVPLPPLPTQQKIAAILSAYDDLIENNNRRIKLLEEMAQRIYREWFVDFRYPGHERVALVDSKLGPIPEGWEWLPASEAVLINPTVVVDRLATRPFVPMTSVSEHGMHITPIELRAGTSGSRFENGDTLFARITPCLENGKTAYVQCLREGEIASGSTEFIVLRSRRLCPEYVYLLARDDRFRSHAMKSMSGATGRQRVRDECFDSFMLAVPTGSALNSFTGLVRPMFKLSYALFIVNSMVRATRDILLPRLISGEIDVTDLAVAMPQAAA